MKTKTNFKKTAIRSGAVVVSFVLISFTVTAQEFWMKILTNSSFNEIAIAMVETGDAKSVNENSTATGADWDSFDMAFDPALELEGWMSDLDRFGVDDARVAIGSDYMYVNAAGVNSTDLIPDADNILSLENWMIEEDVWVN